MKGNIQKLFIISTTCCFLILLGNFSYAEEIVLNVLPKTSVHSSISTTNLTQLTPEKRNEFRILITKKNDKYLWASRENRVLEYKRSGVVHVFIESSGAGYIEVVDLSFLNKASGEKSPLLVKEHLRNFGSNISYWGETSTFNP